MPDLKKVIGELEYCRNNQKCNACEKCQRGGRGVMTCESLVDDAIAILKEQPEIVRCKDCNKRGQSVYRADGTEYIVCWNQGLGIQHPIDWFCADGGRREENDKSLPHLRQDEADDGSNYL